MAENCFGCWKMNRACFVGCVFQDVMAGGEVSRFEMESALDKFDVVYVEFCLKSFHIKSDRVALLKSLSYERNKRAKHVLLGSKQTYDDLVAELAREKESLHFANTQLLDMTAQIIKTKQNTQRAYSQLKDLNS